jgi:hypothetical protein
MSESLRGAIFPLSENKTGWIEARNEWMYVGEREADRDEEAHCVCGVRIKNINIIQNRLNANTAEVGNECIHQFEVLRKLCERCRTYECATKSGRYCLRCKRAETRFDTYVRYGSYAGDDYDDAWAEDLAIIKWEWENGIYDFDPHFRAYIQYRFDRNVDGFAELQSKSPDFEKLYKDRILRVGKHTGQTFSWIWKNDKKYCVWVAGLDNFVNMDFFKYSKYMLGYN